MVELERDLDRTSKLLSIYASMQKLLEQSNKIKSQAEKEKKKAEMRHFGVWDDVQECRDKTSVIHDETRTLLRSKILLEKKFEEQKKLLTFRTISMETSRIEYERAEKVSLCMKYCMPGNLVYTKYGECVINAYRQKDDMVIVLVSFYFSSLL